MVIVDSLVRSRGLEPLTLSTSKKSSTNWANCAWLQIYNTSGLWKGGKDISVCIRYCLSCTRILMFRECLRILFQIRTNRSQCLRTPFSTSCRGFTLLPHWLSMSLSFWCSFTIPYSIIIRVPWLFFHSLPWACLFGRSRNILCTGFFSIGYPPASWVSRWTTYFIRCITIIPAIQCDW